MIHRSHIISIAIPINNKNFLASLWGIARMGVRLRMVLAQFTIGLPVNTWVFIGNLRISALKPSIRSCKWGIVNPMRLTVGFRDLFTKVLIGRSNM